MGFSDTYEEIAFSFNTVEFEGEVVSCEGKDIEIKIGQNLFRGKVKNIQNNSIMPNTKYYFVKRLMNSIEINWDKCFEHFVDNHTTGDKVEGTVSGKMKLDNNLVLYFIHSEGYTCSCASREYLEEKSLHTFIYSRHDNEKKRIYLKYFLSYDM